MALTADKADPPKVAHPPTPADAANADGAAHDGTDGGLRRDLKLRDAAAFSIGLIGPVGAMALLGVGAAALLGRGAPLAFFFAIFGVGLVAYGFVQLSRHISDTGSVYALVGKTIGPRSGFVAGWALIAAYVAIAAGSTIEIGLFFNRFLSLIHVGTVHEWIWEAVIALAIIGALSLREIKLITNVLLGIEIAGAVLVAILSGVIIIRLAIGHGPAGQTLSGHIFSLPAGGGFSAVAGAAVFGFLAFAGFEGAASLGGESENPRRDIPRAITVAVVVVALFYMLVIVGQTLGYGVSPTGVKAFQQATSPYADLGTAYLDSAYAAVLNLIAAISLLAITVGTLAGAARVSYAISRDAAPKSPLTRVNARGTPVVTMGIAALAVLAAMIGQRLAGTDEKTATFYWLTIGTLAILIAYALATLGALKFLFFTGAPKAPRWQIGIPVLGLIFVVYTIYKNVVGVSGPYRYFPYYVLAWLIIGFILVAAVPGVVGRVRAELDTDDSTTAKPAAASAGTSKEPS
jgi:amino acid transporter